MAFEGAKPAILSKAVVGNTASLASVIAAIIVAKTHLPPEIVNEFIVPLVIAGLGSLVGIFGRLVARTGISGIFK